MYVRDRHSATKSQSCRSESSSPNVSREMEIHERIRQEIKIYRYANTSAMEFIFKEEVRAIGQTGS